MNFQKSVWSSNEPSAVHHRQSLTTDSKKNINNNQLPINVWSDEISENRENKLKKSSSPIRLCIQCFIFGSLLAGIPLAVILTIWLSSSSNTTFTSSISSTTTPSIFTTSTTTETTTTTSVTISTTAPTLPCSLTATVSSSILYMTTNTITSVYNCYAFAWTSSVTGSVNLTFEFRRSSSYWYLDDVSVYEGAIQILVNGGFETGSLSPWIRTTPNGNCVVSPGAQVNSVSRHSGAYSLQDGCRTNADQISQEFTATVGQIYYVSFWLQSASVGFALLANVTLS